MRPRQPRVLSPPVLLRQPLGEPMLTGSVLTVASMYGGPPQARATLRIGPAPLFVTMKA